MVEVFAVGSCIMFIITVIIGMIQDVEIRQAGYTITGIILLSYIVGTVTLFFYRLFQ